MARQLESGRLSSYLRSYASDVTAIAPDGRTLHGREAVAQPLRSVRFERVRYVVRDVIPLAASSRPETLREDGTIDGIYTVDGTHLRLCARYVALWVRVRGVWQIAHEAMRADRLSDESKTNL